MCNKMLLHGVFFFVTVMHEFFFPFSAIDVSAFLADLSVSLLPLGDRVAVLPDEKEATSSGGIMLPDTTEEDPKQMGTVVAYGRGGMGKDGLIPFNFVRNGDRVLFGKYIGDDINLRKKDGTDVMLKILHVDAILAICNSSTPS
jgi:chaperonin GroES